MSTVFLLGAGFSRAISRNMPLTRELSSDVIQRYNATIPAQIRAMIEEDFEKALTYLAQHKPWLPESENLRHRALYLDISNVLRHIFSQKVNDPHTFGTNSLPHWLEFLIFYWQQNRSPVLTLNYDTLIERVAGMQSWKLSRGIPTRDLYPISLTPASQRGATQLTPSAGESFKLFKPHGSINWFYSGQSDFFGETLYFVPCLGGVDSLFTSAEGQKHPEQSHLVHTHDKVSLIIPPTLDKSVFFQHETLRSLWFQAGNMIANATRVVCIGYSLPGSDLTMAQFLKNCAPADRVEFEIVNLDPNAKVHFAEILGKDSYHFVQNDSGDDVVPRFVIRSLAEDKEDQNYLLRTTPWKKQSASNAQQAVQRGEGSELLKE